MSHGSSELNPYEPPASTEQPAPITGSLYEYRSLAGITFAVTVCLVANMLVNGTAILSSLFTAAPVSPEEADAVDIRTGVIVLGELGTLIAGAICFCIFVVRANRNARALGATGLAFSPGGAAASFFIPIINLWKPYQALKEIWRASQPGELYWKFNSTPSVFPVWWATWIIGRIAGNGGGRGFSSEKSAPELEIASYLGAGSSAFLIVAAIAAVLIVRDICRRQEDSSRLRPTVSPSLPQQPQAAARP